MPDEKGNVSEQERADLAKRRGQAAASITDQDKKREFVNAQGNEEAKNKGTLPVLAYNRLNQEAETTNALKSYKRGTDYVPKTGPAKLHEGEAVLPKHEAEHYRNAKAEGDVHKIYDLAHEHMADKKDKPKKEIKEIRTRKAKSGGYIHEHHHTHPADHPMEEHTSGDQDSMVAHMMEHIGAPNPGEDAADAGPQAAVGQGAGPMPVGGAAGVPMSA